MYVCVHVYETCVVAENHFVMIASLFLIHWICRTHTTDSV